MWKRRGEALRRSECVPLKLEGGTVFGPLLMPTTHNRQLTTEN